MSHAGASAINMTEVLAAEPIRASGSVRRLAWFFIAIGLVTFGVGFFAYPRSLLWGSYYINFIFFTGLSVGAVMLSVIFQIVRALWSGPVRRISEANVAFLPYAFVFFLLSYFGRHELFPWARGEFPGRGFWMEPNLVYLRFTILLGILFLGLRCFVRLSLREDVGTLQEKSPNAARWKGGAFKCLTAKWLGSDREVAGIQHKLSVRAPVMMMLYIVIYSLFVFEMLMAMDPIWYANMFGGFNFVGNLYMGWAVVAITTITCARNNPQFAKIVTTQQLWDLGKLTFAFTILWGYLFFAHFLPQWYGNMPEETQWMILRTREYPWRSVAWTVFALSFVIPFILLLSRDLKKSPIHFRLVAAIILVGVWLEKYLLVMPQLSPTTVPFGALDLGLFLGFFGCYLIAITGFLAKYPFVALAHPLTSGRNNW
jgi:hypothetical protein